MLSMTSSHDYKLAKIGWILVILAKVFEDRIDLVFG